LEDIKLIISSAKSKVDFGLFLNRSSGSINSFSIKIRISPIFFANFMSFIL